MNTLQLKFCKRYNITEKQFVGLDKIDRSLILSNLESIPTGFNPTVGGSLDLNRLTLIPEGFNPTIGCDLILSNLTTIPGGFSPTVGGWLDLSNLTSIPEGFNPIVGGDLYLSNLTSISEGFNPIVGGSLDLSNLTTSIPKGFNPIVGGSLDLSKLTLIPTGFNPTVGGDLYLRNLKSIPTGFSPTVGEWLDLSNLTSIPNGFNPIVGRKIYNNNNNLNIPYTKPDKNYIFSWQNGKYICIDGIFCEVISKKKNLYKVKRIYNEDIFYIVGDGNGSWAHGNTIDEAKKDLIYKISNRDTSIYENLTLESELTHEEAIQCYMVITGACSFGTKDFVMNKLGDRKKDTYTIREIIEITGGEYGNGEFGKFFKK